MTLELALLGGFALLAGFIDAIAGGGGLIQLPALLAVFPQSPLATLFGTNKFASIWGTAGRGHVLWVVVATMAVCNVAGSLAGSRLAVRLGSGFVRRIFLVVVAVLIAKLAIDMARAW